MSVFKEDVRKATYTRTVIVGSGLAGIAASLNFLDNKYNDFLVYEALDRVGGRCYTIEYQDSFLEIGAQYLHGQIDNPIYYVARDNKQLEERFNEIYYVNEGDKNEDNNGISIERRSDDSEDDPRYVFTTQFGEKISVDKAYEIYNIVNKVIREAKDYTLDENNMKLLKTDISVGEFVQKRLESILSEGFEHQLNHLSDSELRKLVEGFLVWRCKSENIEIGCHSICDLSLKSYSIFKDLKGMQIMEPLYGYGSIIKCFIKPHETEFNKRLNLNKALQTVLICNKHDLNDSVEMCEHCLYTNDSSKIVLLFSCESGHEIVICENVICTMSLGYMKENLKNLIKPVGIMPKEKLTAVDNLGYGTINKIFMKYDEPFWSDNLEGIFNVWLKENEADPLLDQTKGFTKKNWFENICYFETVNDQDNLLSAWYGGCQFSEDFSDEQIINDCTMVLRKMLKDETIPKPSSIIRSKWGSNKYFKGSYTYMKLGSNESDLFSYAAPIMLANKPVVLFAGEGTSHRQFSCAHGAFNTGLKESERILNDLQIN